MQNLAEYLCGEESFCCRYHPETPGCNKAICIPINFRGAQIAALSSLTCNSDSEEDLYILETGRRIPWCIGCTLLRQCINNLWTVIIPEENPYYFLDICQGRIWEVTDFLITEILGRREGDYLVDTITQEVYVWIENRWKLLC